MPVVVVRSIVALLIIATLIVFAAPAAATPEQAPPGEVDYSPPVDAPVADPFRPPTTPYGPGNRGIEYATAPGTTVVASADGTVQFAGVVAGRQWVTLHHDDGVRTTYGPLAEFNVSAGETVHRGDPLGSSAGALLFTARIDDAYIDPASLLDAGPPRVYLVPEPLDLPMRPNAAGGGWSLPGADALLSAIDWEIRHLAATPGVVVSLTPLPALTAGFNALVDWQQRRDDCTSPFVAPPPPKGRRVAVLVGGLGSSSTAAAVADVDTSSLGYGSGDVVRFSYVGGRVPAEGEVSADLAAIDVTEYGPGDTVSDLEVAGHRFAEMLLQVAEAAPAGVPVDVIAHSQGGLVARFALAELATSHPDALTRLGVVVTLGTPHQGADLAGLVQAANQNPLAQPGLAAVEAVADLPISPDDVAAQQLAPGSDLLVKLAHTPPPPGVPFLSIAARGDLVVPSTRAQLDGATNVIVPVDGLNDHDRLPESAAVTREMALGLGGLGPTCENVADAVIDAVSGRLTSDFTHLLAVTQGA